VSEKAPQSDSWTSPRHSDGAARDPRGAAQAKRPSRLDRAQHLAYDP